MKTSRIKHLLLIAGVAAIILLAGRIQLPKYANRLNVIAILAAVDMFYWISVKKAIKAKSSILLNIAYWLPVTLLVLFFLVGIVVPYSDWPPFPRIYFPGVLLVLLIGKGIFLTILTTGDTFNSLVSLYKRRTAKSNHDNNKILNRKGILLSASLSAMAIMLIFFSGMVFWVRDFKLNTVEIKATNLPKSFDGYRIVQISDLHLGTFLNTKPIESIISIVNAQHPDLIVFTGDLVNFRTDEAFPFEHVMKGFMANDGIYSILGNHDYGDYSTWPSEAAKDSNDRALFSFYNRIGWKLLRNQNVVLKRNTSAIALIGVENWSMAKQFGKRGNLIKAMAGTDTIAFKILLSHDPSHWDYVIRRKIPEISLTLSGHTHAFQLALETNSIKLSPAALLYHQWGGLYTKENLHSPTQYLYVNRGVGTLGYPGRILARPEITLIILRKSN